MIEIGSPEFGKVAQLFQNIDHSIAIVHAVIEGNSPGRIFIDDVSTPSCAFLYPDRCSQNSHHRSFRWHRERIIIYRDIIR